MCRLRVPKISWLFTLLCIGYFFTSVSMHSIDHSLMTSTYEIDELREKFSTILKMQPEFIHIYSTESQYKAANGIYKLIPYYEKLSPELTSVDIKSSRFIIHKHVISGQWQLTEFDAYPLSKNIKAFPVTAENEKNALMNNRFIQSQNIIYNMEEAIMNMQTEKDKNIKSLKNQNDLLTSCLGREKEKHMNKKNKTQNEMESKLIEKENQIRYLFESQNELQSKLIQKDNDICEINKTQTQLESKLIEKDNQIRDFEKIKNRFQTKLLEQKNEIHNFKTKNLEILSKSKEDLKLFDNENQINRQKLSKCQKLNEKLQVENKNLKSREKLLYEEIENLYVTNYTLENNLKETKVNSQKCELQEIKNVLDLKCNALQKQLEILSSRIKIEKKTANNNQNSNESLELDFEIETNILLNFVHINAENIKEEEMFDPKIEFEEPQTPKMETPLSSEQSKRQKNKVRTKLNFQTSDEVIEQKKESIKAEKYENKQILENNMVSEEKNVEVTLSKKTPKKKKYKLCTIACEKNQT